MSNWALELQDPCIVVHNRYTKLSNEIEITVFGGWVSLITQEQFLMQLYDCFWRIKLTFSSIHRNDEDWDFSLIHL